MSQPKFIKKVKGPSAHSTQLLISAAAGGILGAGTALLLAPKSGTKLREDIYDTCKDINCYARGEDHPHRSNSTAIMGGIAGAVLGAALIYYLRSDEEEIETTLGRKIKDAGKTVVNNASNWIETAKDVVDDIHDKVHQFDEDVEERTEKASTNINEILEWAQLGLRVWNNLQKRK